MKKKNAICSITDHKIKLTDLAIEKAISEGYLNPKEDKDLRKTLFPTWNGKTYFRPILEFGYIEYSMLQHSNVKLHEVDELYCNTHLTPLLELNGSILNPVMTSKLTDEIEEMEHGHGRSFSSNAAWPTRPIPRFLLDDRMFETSQGGDFLSSEPVKSSFMKEIGKIICNPPPKSNTYAEEDVPIHIMSLLKSDPCWGGVNPSGAFPTKEIFNKIMDKLHPEQFLHCTSRGRIFAALQRGNPASKIRPITSEQITSDLVTLGIDPGIKDSGSRETFGNHYDQGTNSLVGIVTTNGKDFERNVILELLKDELDGQTDSTVKGVVVYTTIYKPNARLPKLEKQREDFLTEVKKWNARLDKIGAPSISKVIFPKQLTDSRDIGRKWGFEIMPTK